MGADNLKQFHRWREWRNLARLMPIAVIARPGYDDAVLASCAMAWLGRYRKPPASLNFRETWSAPALLTLRFDPDPSSATALRRADPDWADRLSDQRELDKIGVRDQVTYHVIPGDAA
jgi:nicotinate-nucleotide adenylyltransferase